MAENLSAKESSRETEVISELEKLKEFLKQVPDNEMVTISFGMTKDELEKGVKELYGRAKSEGGA